MAQSLKDSGGNTGPGVSLLLRWRTGVEKEELQHAASAHLCNKFLGLHLGWAEYGRHDDDASDLQLRTRVNCRGGRHAALAAQCLRRRQRPKGCLLSPLTRIPQPFALTSLRIDAC
jgi:hypothetical protein